MDVPIGYLDDLPDQAALFSLIFTKPTFTSL